jgi:hypothetical protein
VTSPPQSGPGDGAPAGQYLRPVRDLGAYALVGATALWLLEALIALIPSGPFEFSTRTESSFGNFINVVTILFPLGAVLLSVLVRPQHPKARLIVLVALIEYAVMAVFGIVFGLLIGLINLAAHGTARNAFEALLGQLGYLAVLAVAAYATFLIWQHTYGGPRAAHPTAPPGVYGQPPQTPPWNQPPGNPAPPPHGNPAPVSSQPMSSQPMSTQPMSTQPMSSQPAPGQPGAPAQPPYGAHAAGQPPYGAPDSAPPAYGQPPYGAPDSAPPAYGQPGPGQGPGPSTYGTPAPGQHAYGGTYGSPDAAPSPFGGQPGGPSGADEPAAPPFSEPTHMMPRYQHDDDRTRPVDDNRPGFGPAEPDPPRN